MHEVIKGIMKRERIPATKVAAWCKITEISFRRMLRGEINMDIDVFNDALDKLGYKMIIVKKDDILK